MSEHEAGECRACAVRLRQELQNTAGISSNRSWSRAHVHVCVYRLPYTCCRASDSTHVTERRGCCRRGEELPPRLPAATRASRTLCSAVFRPQAGFSPDFKRQVSAAQTRPPEGCLINRGFRNKVHFSEEKKLVPQCVMMSSPGRERASWAVCSSGDGGVGSSARRCLFGEVDHEELQHNYTLLMRAELVDASRRWSFDFTADRPLLGGDFQWVELPEVRVPFLYRDCTVGAEPRPKGAEPTSHLQQERWTPEQCDGHTHSAERHTLKRKQTNITDFYQAKRRVVTTRKSGQ